MTTYNNSTNTSIPSGVTAGTYSSANITVNAAGQITAASNGSVTGNFVNQTTASVTLAADTVYLTNAGASLVTYTLPAAPAVGDVYEVIGFSAGGWTIAQNASNVIHFGSVTTTTGAGGSLSSSNQYDKVTLRCAAANTWVAYNSQGNLTYV